MVTATRDQASTEEGSNQPYWMYLQNSEKPHRRVRFLDAGHATFTVACEHFPTLEQDDGCGESFTPVLEAQAVMLSYTLIFARAHLWQDQESLTLLEGLDNLTPLETLYRSTDSTSTLSFDPSQLSQEWVEWMSPTE
jgi:hypothetical protein